MEYECRKCGKVVNKKKDLVIVIKDIFIGLTKEYKPILIGGLFILFGMLLPFQPFNFIGWVVVIIAILKAIGYIPNKTNKRIEEENILKANEK